jgi:hypothetical protein
VKALSGKKQMSRQQVVDWLERVREDARSLAGVWADLAAQLEKRNTATPDVDEGIFTKQAPVYYRLLEFYLFATVTVSGQMKRRVL